MNLQELIETEKTCQRSFDDAIVEFNKSRKKKADAETLQEAEDKLMLARQALEDYYEEYPDEKPEEYPDEKPEESESSEGSNEVLESELVNAKDLRGVIMQGGKPVAQAKAPTPEQLKALEKTYTEDNIQQGGKNYVGVSIKKPEVKTKYTITQRGQELK